jgi:hypothetical protein
MESVWFLDGGATPFVDPVLVLLERGRVAAKTLGFGGWKSFDLL